MRKKCFISCDERGGKSYVLREMGGFNRCVRRKVFIFCEEKGWKVSRGFNTFQQVCKEKGFYFLGGKGMDGFKRP